MASRGILIGVALLLCGGAVGVLTTRLVKVPSRSPRPGRAASGPRPVPSPEDPGEGGPPTAAGPRAPSPDAISLQGEDSGPLVREPGTPGRLDFESLRWYDAKPFALLASPAVDASTGEAPAVAPGKSAEMELEAFVAAGGRTPAPVVELAGKRKPELEEGIPVSLTGRVIEAEGGAPVVGARLVVTSTFYVRRYFYDHHLREVARAETGADGGWRIDRLDVDPAHFGSGGRLYLSVTAEGRAPALAVELAKVTPGIANRMQDVVLARAAGSLRGRVLDLWEGKPVVGARVYATGAIDPVSYPKDERPALFVGAPTAVTDAEGRFVLEGLGKGIQFISVHGGDDCAGSDPVTIPFEKEFAMRTRALRGRIEGTTVDGHGDPVALVTVEGGENTTHSFADGRFVLENFRGTEIPVTFTHPDYDRVVVRAVRDGTTGLVVRLDHPRPLLVLEVKDRDTGTPVATVEVTFRLADGSTGAEGTSAKRLAADGRYPVRLPERAVVLTVAAEGRAAVEVALPGRADGEVVPVVLGTATE